MIQDYECRPEDSDHGMLEVIRTYQLPVPEIYVKMEEILRFAKLEKEQNRKPFCTIPFDHTLEAGAMGGNVRYGNETAGPRAEKPICQSLEELKAISGIDFDSGRMKETLDVCRELRKQGEEVLFQMSGPLTIWNTLIDVKHILKGIRKTPDQMEELFRMIETEMLRLLVEVKQAGVRLVSYADSAGSVRILGPKSMEWMTRTFTAPFLKKAADILGDDMAMILCPKTAFALIGTDLGKRGECPLPGEMTYQEACVCSIGKAKFPSQMCINRCGTKITNGKLMTIGLKESDA